MNDTEFETQQQRLHELSEKWIKPLGLGWYKIDFAYAREEYRPPKETTSKDDSLAYCHTDWRYGFATITWNMPEVANQKDDDLERAFVHELMHIFVHEMRWTADNSSDSLDHEERVCSNLTNGILWLRDSLVEQKA